MAPYEYITSLPSKGIRNRAIEAFNVWFEVSEEKLTVIKSIIGLLHNSSLMYNFKDIFWLDFTDQISPGLTTLKIIQTFAVVNRPLILCSVRPKRSTQPIISSFLLLKRPRSCRHQQYQSTLPRSRTCMKAKAWTSTGLTR
jgi:hypothetical protein